MTTLFHVGVSVSDVTSFVRVFEECFGFTLISRRTVDHDYIGNLIGVPGATADIAMLDFGDGKFLELITWKSESGGPLSSDLFDLSHEGTHHICIYVENAEVMYEKLSGVSEVKMISDSPFVVPTGPNVGCKVFFVLILGRIYVEIFERVKQ